MSKKKSSKENNQLDLVNLADIKKVIQATLENDGIDDLKAEIANYYHLQVNKYAQLKANELYSISLQNNSQNRKITHSTLQDKLNNLINDIRLYEKGLKMFSNVDIQLQLSKYLLKSLGTDLVNEIFHYVAVESDLNFASQLTTQVTPEQRNRIATECQPAFKAPLIALNKSLNGTIEDFLIASEYVLVACSMIMKKIDKKKDK